MPVGLDPLFEFSGVNLISPGSVKLAPPALRCNAVPLDVAEMSLCRLRRRAFGNHETSFDDDPSRARPQVLAHQPRRHLTAPKLCSGASARRTKPTPNRITGLRARLHDATDERNPHLVASFWRPELGAKIIVLRFV